MANKKIYICKCCGSKFYSYKENANYCSLECKNKDTRFEHNCDYCGKLITITKGERGKLNNGTRKHKYCSKECQNKAQDTRVLKICEYCNKQFKIGRCYGDIQRFCSKECYNLSVKPKNKICPICEKEFFPRWKNAIFCSTTCAGKSIQNRTECSCEICGKQLERKKSEVDKK